VPVVLRFAVPVDIAGPYNAWRMLLHNGGILIATTVAAFIPVEVLLILTVILQLYSGIQYFTAKELRSAV
jgi:Tfp pilus assembly protein PilZ